MGFLLDAVSQRKFEIQRDTVKNERAQNYDNRPYGLMWEKWVKRFIPKGTLILGKRLVMSVI